MQLFCEIKYSLTLHIFKHILIHLDIMLLACLQKTHSSNLNMFQTIKLLIGTICFLKSITFAILNYMLEHFICGIIYTYHSNILSASSQESLDTIICYTRCMYIGRTL